MTRPTCEDCGTRPADVAIREHGRGHIGATTHGNYRRDICGSCLTFRQHDVNDFLGVPLDVHVIDHYTNEEATP